MRSKMMIPVFIALASCLFAIQPNALAKDGNKPSILVLNTYIVKPDKTVQFESVMKDFVAEMKKDNSPYEMIMHETGNYTYMSMWYFDNYSMMDTFDEYWARLSKKIGTETMDKYHEQEFSAIESFNIALLQYRPDQSFKIENPRVIGDEFHFAHWEYYYIDPERNAEWQSLENQWVRFFSEKNIDIPFQTFTGSVGYNRPVWIFINWGKSRTDYFQSKERINEEYGGEMKNLFKRNTPLIKRKEETFSFLRRDLSYFPYNR
jgi:hypothetical protein